MEKTSTVRMGGYRSGSFYARKKYEESNKVNIEVEFKPKRGQLNIINLARRPEVKKLVVTVFRQYGKSFVARYITLSWMLNKDVTVGYMSPTNRLGKEVYKKFVTFLPEPLIKSKNGTDLIIELVNGSRLLFFSIESIQTVRGFTLDYLIWDEVAHSREYTPDGEHVYWNIIAPLLDAKGKKELFISTPNGASGFFYEEYMKARQGQEGYAFFKADITDDETKTKEFIEKKRREYPELRFRQEYMCEFLDNGISYFKNFDDCFVDTPFDFKQKLWGGIDFSSVGEDETILTFINQDRQTIQYKIEGELDEKYRKLSALLNLHANNIIHVYMESNSIGEVMGNEVRKLLFPQLKDKVEFKATTNKSKNEYVDLLAYDIENNEITFSYDEDLREQFKVFTYTKTRNGKMTFGAADGYHDDRIISLCLANLSQHEKKRLNREYVRAIKR